MRKARFIAFFGALLIRAIIFTLRIRLDDRAGVTRDPKQPPLIWLFWHNRLFLVPYFFERYLAGRQGAALTSASRDGDYLAAFIEQFGIRPIRGSSSRRGVAALLELRGLLASGSDVAITPDGPRGPRYHLSPGIVLLAQKTGAPIIPMSIDFSRAWRLGRWDGFFLPQPFARAVVTIGETGLVPKTTTPEGFEAERLRLEQMLNALMITP